MSNARFTISAFGDEIADDLVEQLAVLRDLQIRYLELRGVWGKNVLELSDAEAQRVRELADQYGIGISAIGSPIGKSPIEEPIATPLANLERLIAIGKIVGTTKVRVFSFYPPAGVIDENNEQALIATAVERLAALTNVADAAGATLLLENEKGIVGDTVARTEALLAGVNHPALRFAWDPANFVQVGEAAVTTTGWPPLSPYIGYVHIKDALMDGSVRPAGEGDGQVGELLAKLRQSNYTGLLALEPHLAVAGHSSGFSGPEGMKRAVEALRALMAAQGCVEE